VGELLFNLLFLGDVAIDDHHLLHFCFGVSDGAGGGLENSPGAAFVAQAILRALADAGSPSLPRGRQNLRTIFGVNLLEDGRPGKFSCCVAPDFGIAELL